MQTLKSAQEMFLNRSITIIAFILAAFHSNAQVQGNTGTQTKSPNANMQVGNNNLNKLDNRKYYSTKNETSNEGVFNTGPLFTGDNPFVTINNIYPNIDSIKYEIALKRKNIREVLSDFMFEGYNLKIRCVTDTSVSKLNTEYKVWTDKVSKFLNEKLDRSYNRQFDLTEIAEAYAIYLENQNDDFTKLWRLIYAKLQKLDSFITSLY